MSFQENDFTSANLFGNANVPRNVSPLLRAAKRRADPTGSVGAPFYDGLAGLKLDLEYTDMNLVVQTVTITFTSIDYGAALAAVAAADTANLVAIDMDGYLAIRSRNAGATHYLKVLPQTVPAEEAAEILGFVVDPFPGSISYAGEIASAPGTRKQNNPQGTALITKHEDLSDLSLNRVFASLLHFIERDKIGLDRECAVVESRGITLLNNPTVAGADGISGGAQTTVANVFVLNDPTLRIPTGFFTTPDPGGFALEDIFRLTRNGADVLFSQSLGGGRYRIRSVHYSSQATTANFRSAGNLSATFAVWGTPDDKSIFGSVADLVRKNKHAAIDITKVQGDRITCPGALFITKHVQKGDTVRITGATSTVPFSHNGEFIVDRVWDEETLSLRSKSPHELLVFANETRPSELNNVPGFGQATIPIGYFLTAANLVFTLERVSGVSWGLLTSASGTFGVLLKSGKALREATTQALARELNISPDSIVSYIDDHVTSGGHPATAISGTGPTWGLTSEVIAGTNVQTLLTNLVAMLSDAETVSSAEFGSSRVGSGAITGDSPNHTPLTLSSGSLKSQLKAIIQQVNSHMNDAAAHAGGGGAYSGSPNWKDATSIAPGISIDAAIDRIVTDLGGSGGANGAAKVAIAARSSWLGGRTNGADSVFGAVEKIITDLSGTVVGDDGSERIGAQATSDLSAGSVRSQLDGLASGWGRLIRANTWSASQIVNGAAAGGSTNDPLPALRTTVVPGVRKLLWEAAMTSGQKVRLYASPAGLEITRNAIWNETVWFFDQGGQDAHRFVMGSSMLMYTKTGSGTWVDAGWTQNFSINTQPSTGMSPAVENTFTAPQIFNGGVSDETLASLKTTAATTTRRLLWEFNIDAQYKGRFYVSGLLDFEFTRNARWNGSSWTTDVSSTSAERLCLSRVGFLFQRRAAPAGTTFTDSNFLTLAAVGQQGVWPVSYWWGKKHGAGTTIGASGNFGIFSAVVNVGNVSLTPLSSAVECYAHLTPQFGDLNNPTFYTAITQTFAKKVLSAWEISAAFINSNAGVLTYSPFNFQTESWALRVFWV